MTKLGPCPNSLSSASVNGVLDMFLTQFSQMISCWLSGEIEIDLEVSVIVVVWLHVVIHVLLLFSLCAPCWGFERPPGFSWHNLLNLDRCLSKVLRCLLSLLISMNVLHSSMIALSRMSSYWFIHVSLKFLNMVMVLVIDLILSLSKAFSALWIMYLAFGVLMVLFNLTLVGMMLLLRHLREKRL